jgi:hypothetical protein
MMKLKGILISSMIVVCLIISVNVVNNYIKRTSSAFHEAKNFVESDKDIAARVGKVKGYGISIDGDLNSPEGHSNLSFDVFGSLDTVRINTSLEKTKYGGWNVKKWKYEE